MNVAEAEEVLSGYPSTVLSEVYDDDEELRVALLVLFPEFEYPDFSHLTTEQIHARFKRMSKIQPEGRTP